ncbi:MAG: DUF4114 domain-containing protein, partial [Synechococcus sp.]
SMPSWVDTSQTQFTLGDFDADNFTDIAFLGSQAAGNPIEVRSSRNGLVLSLFKSGLSGEIGLSSGFSSFHNLGLETLYMYQKYEPFALVQAANLRAAMYVAHSNLSDNPYYDQAKYYGYASSDEQTLLTKPIGQLSATLGFDWLLADRFSANPLLNGSAASGDPITAYSQPLELDATFNGYYANPVLLASRGLNREVLTYTTQSNLDQLPYFSTDLSYRDAAKQVIRLFYSYLQRLPSPSELHRLSERISRDGKDAGYIEAVITYTGNYDARNPISVDAIADRYYNHASAEVTYAYQGITDLSNRSTFRMIGDDYQGFTPISSGRLANIATFGLYLDAQLANNMNLDGDIEMYLGYSEKAYALLASAADVISSDPASIRVAELALDAALKGNYSYPMGPSSPLANGLNVESPTYSAMMSTKLSSSFAETPVIADPNAGHNHKNNTNQPDPSIPVVSTMADAEFIDLRTYPAGAVNVKLDVLSDAQFNNTIGLYRVDDITGLIAGQKPGDKGYVEAAFSRTILSFGRGQPLPSGSAQLTSQTFTDKEKLKGGTLLAAYVITNGTINDFRANNPANNRVRNGLNTFFTFTTANPDGVDHFRLGSNTFFVEDLWGGGDKDFNDMSFRVSIVAANP